MVWRFWVVFRMLLGVVLVLRMILRMFQLVGIWVCNHFVVVVVMGYYGE